MTLGRIPAADYPRGLPPWLKKRLSFGQARATDAIVADLGLHTVCAEAACPNRNECFAEGTATFMVLGAVCSRHCGFCNVTAGAPDPVDPDEPARVAEAVRRMGLDYCVITSVTRDDLADGGSGHFAAVIRALRETASCRVEVLTPDFQGRAADIDRVIAAAPDAFNHNVETVARLYPEVRPAAVYRRSLDLLARVAAAGLPAKSGIMVGLGEKDAEVLELFDDLRRAGCALLTIGQYLRPNRDCLPVKEFVTPAHFDHLRGEALARGFTAVAAGPFVRSSHHARGLFEGIGHG
ncbi:MAG: lipoyl synthase [Planctomycetota bacterium]